MKSGLKNMSDALGHFKTITRHRHMVIRHCMKAGIFWQGLGHDLSKYSPTEFLPGARFYSGTHSPNDGEREKYGYSLAWMHHKGRNRHHYEYWTDYDPVTKRLEPVKMPFRCVAEMICDRVAASKIYRGDAYTQEYPLEYFEKGAAPDNMHPQTRDIVRMLLTMLAEKGEDATFQFIKQKIRDKSGY